MNEEKVKEFLNQVLQSVDGGCPYCASTVFQAFSKQWPEWDAVINEVWAANDYEIEGWRDE